MRDSRGREEKDTPAAPVPVAGGVPAAGTAASPQTPQGSNPLDAGGGRADPPSAEEDPRWRAARLARRRRLLLIGGLPALLALAAAGWLGFVSLWTMGGNQAFVHKDYPTAVSRYRTVARVNPWLEQWRVYFNLGTAELAADRLDDALTDLTTALAAAPPASMVTVDRGDGSTDRVKDPSSPECMVRTNLFATHLVLASKARDAGDTAGAEAQTAAATEAADTCEVPPAQQNPDPTPPTPSTSPSPSPSASSSPSASTSPSPSPTPTDAKREELERRNREANESDGTDSVTDGRRW